MQAVRNKMATLKAKLDEAEKAAQDAENDLEETNRAADEAEEKVHTSVVCRDLNFCRTVFQLKTVIPANETWNSSTFIRLFCKTIIQGRIQVWGSETKRLFWNWEEKQMTDKLERWLNGKNFILMKNDMQNWFGEQNFNLPMVEILLRWKDV